MTLRQGRSAKTVERDVGPVSDTDLDFTQIWQNTIATLDADGLPARERAFLTLARLAGLLDGTALVKVPNEYTKDVVEQRVRDAVTRRCPPSSASRCSWPSPSTPRSTSRTTTEDTTGYLDEQPPPARPAARAGRPDQQRVDNVYALDPGRPSRSAARATRSSASPTSRRPGSTRSTPSTPSSSARATGSPTRPPSPSPRRRPRPTTRCSSTASPGWARPTCCTRSGTTRATSTRTSRCAT